MKISRKDFKVGIMYADGAWDNVKAVDHDESLSIWVRNNIDLCECFVMPFTVFSVNEDGEGVVAIEVKSSNQLDKLTQR